MRCVGIDQTHISSAEGLAICFSAGLETTGYQKLQNIRIQTGGSCSVKTNSIRLADNFARVQLSKAVVAETD